MTQIVKIAAIGKTFQFTNKSGYTTKIKILGTSDKSVFYTWAHGNFPGFRTHMSWKQFERYTEYK
jgi:hypothetical protein